MFKINLVKMERISTKICEEIDFFSSEEAVINERIQNMKDYSKNNVIITKLTKYDTNTISKSGISEEVRNLKIL